MEIGHLLLVLCYACYIFIFILDFKSYIDINIFIYSLKFENINSLFVLNFLTYLLNCLLACLLASLSQLHKFKGILQKFLWNSSSILFFDSANLPSPKEGDARSYFPDTVNISWILRKEKVIFWSSIS